MKRRPPMIAALVVLTGCTTADVTLTVVPPSFASRIELIIVSGACPSDELILGDFMCGRQTLYRQSILRGQPLAAPGDIEGQHAIVAVASGGGEVGYACVTRQQPGDTRIQFGDAGSSCGPIRMLLDGSCSDAMCPETDAGPNFDGGPDRDAGPGEDPLRSAEDLDGDGLTNCMECACDRLPDECMCEETLDPASCFDTDRDGTPNYRDSDSDNDGYQDSIECALTDDGRRACDYDVDGVRDDWTRQTNTDDYDGDGIPNVIECSNDELLASCVNSDNDPYPDFRDVDSDNDDLLDRVECENGGLVEPCPSCDGMLPEYQDPNRCSMPGTCDCRFEEYDCVMGDVCHQTDIVVADDILLHWLDNDDDEIDTGMVDTAGPILQQLASLDVPPSAWRCGLDVTCDSESTVAVAAIGNPVVAYLIDLRDVESSELQGFVSEPRLGRFVYSRSGSMIVTQINK